MFGNNLGYIYIICNKNKYNVKIGSTYNYEKRYFNYKTYSPFPWEYIKVYEIIKKPIEDDSQMNCYDIDNKIQEEYSDYLTKNCIDDCLDGGIEWYVNQNDLINKIDSYLKTNFCIKEIEKDKLNYKNFKIYNTWSKLKKDIQLFKINQFTMNEIKYKQKVSRHKPREYQNNYIKECFSVLMTLLRCLMIAPTGSGKTFMFYSIARKILKEKRKVNKKEKVNIIILSPRLSINAQTVSDSNIKLLSYNSDFIKINGKDFNTSVHKYKTKIKDKNINFIISSTYQSIEKMSNFIKDNKIEIDLVIFDECHFIKNWGIKENKTNEEKTHSVKYLKSIEFIMNDTTLIKKRLFCSATPFECQKENINIYGKFVENVKVSDLVNEGYLCPIKTILKDYKDETSLSNLIIKEKLDKNKKKTIIFCNTQANCRSLFGQIKKVINKNGLDIKPYLYIGKSKGDKVNMNEENSKTLDKFENDDEISLIITCKKISMGYDYPKIDFVVFADPKCEKIEIAQCIGRGLRITDNPDKVCHVLLPVNEEEVEDSKFKTIISYFKYMRNECGYEILSSDCWHDRPDSENPNYVPKEGNDYGFDFECSFDNEKLKTKIIDKYGVEAFKKYPDFITLLKDKNITNEEEYNNNSTNKLIPSLENVYTKYPNFCFKDIIKNSNRFYLTKTDAIEAKDLAKKKWREHNKKKKIKNSKLLIELNKIDSKIPIINFDLYYPKIN